jgi:DGQHR domain-containing protein
MRIKAFSLYQKDKEIFLFKADPNFILNMVDIRRDVKNDNYFQRPYEISRIEEIKNYLLGKDKLYKKGQEIYAIGYIPNSIVINLSNKFRVLKTKNDIAITFPSNPKARGFKNSIEILDGQHRLLAFDDETKKSIGGKKYEMCFVAFHGLSIDEKREIFMVLNERQKSVSKNILLRHKKLLKLLLEEDETRYEILIWLNEEKDSPFHQKIIVSGEKIKYGIKLAEFDKDLAASKALDDLVKSDGQLRPN